MKKDFYCRRNECVHHHGIKDDCVLCDLDKPDLFKDKDGRLSCNSLTIDK